MTTQEKAFEEIYRTNYPKVYRLCQGYTNGDDAMSKDLAQEIFIKCWQKRQSFRNDAKVSTWIYRIAVNTCLLELRKKKTVPITDHLKHLEESEDSFSVSKELQLQQLYQCIGKLNTDNKTIILLELEGLPQKEIAEIMGLSHEAIRVRVHRIKNELTQCVEK
ncbi:RNA polymerase sigma factor [Gelidibacter pelagius]|uniref:RNA polymerase sigma factor n=1 Tax=Gelidibacter pelagius TaxID=2819985 RepID=A0ABS3SP73_9FLAO|nr:RNA polymerase sigma factor [Gelidibacter pelagius]MBO3096713.1 RNA polymerase sigma factor [Gelidibacter pelagius]